MAEQFSYEPFSVALSLLMDERSYTYRQLAYRTGLSAGYLNHLSKAHRPVPNNRVLERIAQALHIEPGYFKEYRLRYVCRHLDESPRLVAALYEIMSESLPEDGQRARLLLLELEETIGRQPDEPPDEE